MPSVPLTTPYAAGGKIWNTLEGGAPSWPAVGVCPGGSLLGDGVPRDTRAVPALLVVYTVGLCQAAWLLTKDTAMVKVLFPLAFLPPGSVPLCSLPWAWTGGPGSVIGCGGSSWGKCPWLSPPRAQNPGPQTTVGQATLWVSWRGVGGGREWPHWLGQEKAGWLALR